jgi:hypothetical protein
MNNQEIIGMLSAWTAAKEMPYGSNMTISAALVVEMVESIVELEAQIQTAQVDKLAAIAIERKRWARADLVALEILRLEQQAKGVRDFFTNHRPKISMGKSAIWEVDDVLVDGCIEQLTTKANALKEPKT